MPGDNALANAVLDASVAVRLLAPEKGSDEAAELFERPLSWLAPRLLVTEIAAALRRKVVAGVVSQQFSLEAMEAFRRIVEEGALRFATDESWCVDALRLALTTQQRVPDCLYLALAQREGAALATADRALAELAQQRKVNVHFVSPA